MWLAFGRFRGTVCLLQDEASTAESSTRVYYVQGRGKDFSLDLVRWRILSDELLGGEFCTSICTNEVDMLGP